MTDEEEIYYYGTNPLLADTDHDGLDDRTEVELWYDPLEADYDKDGRLDLQEYEEGTDPFGYTEDWNDYAWDFICGVVAGDIIENPENVATMLGQVAGSFIPLMDLRDVLANLAYENYGYALLSGAGLIPVLGDGAKTLGAFVEFILKNIDNTAMIVDVFTQLSRNADWLIKEAAKNEKFQEAVKILHSKSDNLKLTKQQTEVVNEVIEKADMSEYKITNLVETTGLSKNKISHILKNHTFEKMKLTIDSMMEKGLVDKAQKLINDKTFFNPSWTKDDVEKAVMQAYNEVLEQGYKEGTHIVNVMEEEISVYIENGVLHTAYGNHKLTLKDFGY